MRFNYLSFLIASPASILSVVRATPTTAALPNTATVNLNNSIGATKFLASGFIYGFPDNGTNAQTSIPDYLIKDIKFGATRAGGAQISAPGWASGGYEGGYQKRFESALSNYRSARKYGGAFILLPHDLWGAQGGGAPQFPGDDGNWSEMEKFWNQVIADVKDNDMLDGLVIDIWNEPDGSGFWARSWAQYVEYYVRTTKLIRAALPDVLISGPSTAHSPSLDSENWKAWMSAVAGNQTVPDIYSWHQIGEWEREPDSTVPDFNKLRADYGLPEKPIDVNEYGWNTEQNPANSVYYISQLERHNIRGLRSNWASGSDLHDYMGNLVAKKNGQYVPNGDWQLYKYYAEMVGERLETIAASDPQFDVFAVRERLVLKVIAGTRSLQRNGTITITGLESLGFASSDLIGVRRYRFDWNGPQAEVGKPVDLAFITYRFTEGTINIPFAPPTNTTAFSYEIALRRS
ncbi:unnamed protein product [Periconia digitata]|uniref:Glycoside hydrolase family 5 domain-containing protein n=1 Tax=Periconia digitata TaxID=1303443 RepID=A0A9W4U4L6_9PLEO|nr:unnamed protein product [Periconia digitata]